MSTLASTIASCYNRDIKIEDCGCGPRFWLPHALKQFFNLNAKRSGKFPECGQAHKLRAAFDKCNSRNVCVDLYR